MNSAGNAGIEGAHDACECKQILGIFNFGPNKCLFDRAGLIAVILRGGIPCRRDNGLVACDLSVSDADPMPKSPSRRRTEGPSFWRFPVFSGGGGPLGG